ncbi:ADP-ribosylation factor-like protein, partial [Salmonella sp. SAL4443]|uniref:ADP-ribosylation factor-like protein n=1 Tax=Salmonella sp. SAL4443 TaxID=3159898 RepID=UPI003978C12B
TEALNKYYADRAKESLPLNELKVILVGTGGAGKTSLVKRLMGESFDAKEKQTHGINIKKWMIPTDDGTEVKLNFWDFGG